jgi:hypothetical protein
MEIPWEHTQELGPGSQPAAIHSADNHVQIFYVNPADEGKIYVMDAPTPMGAWDSRIFNDAYMACRDIDVQHLKLKYLSGTNIWAVWRNDAEDSDEDYVEGYERHRIAVFTLLQNVSKFLSTGSVEFSQNNPVTQLVLELKNPNQEVSSEDDSVIAPGAQVSIFFRAGSSDRYPLGRYFVDRNKMSVTEGATNVEARNAIGKLLRDQSFDENSELAFDNLATVLGLVLDDAGVPEDSRVIYPSANDVGMRFPPDMKILDGISEILKTAIHWTIKENMEGKIILGPHWWTEFDQPGVYNFQRGTDVWSREVTREDAEAFSRVCVWTAAYSVREVVGEETITTDYPAIYKYADVEVRFPLPRKKTLYVQVAQGTAEARMIEYAAELAELQSNVGVIETFVGPIRPHLQPGDEARIHDVGSKLLGVITTVRHGFIPFLTEFVVDSGGQVGRAQIRDYIEKIAGKQVSPSNVKRLYS